MAPKAVQKLYKTNKAPLGAGTVRLVDQECALHQVHCTVRRYQACDFVGYYVIYVNLSKMEVIYVFVFFRGYYVIFLKSWG